MENLLVVIYDSATRNPLGLGLRLNGHVLTCDHVVASCASIRIQSFTTGEALTCRSISRVAEADLALVELEESPDHLAPPVRLTTRDPFRTQIRTWGVPEAFPEGVQVEARVGRADRSGRRLLEPTADSPSSFTKGFSGSPVFDDADNLIGIVSDAARNQGAGRQPLGRMISVSNILAVLPDLAALVQVGEPDLHANLQEYLSSLYESEGTVRFVEVHQQSDLLDIFVDVPVQLGDSRLARRRSEMLLAARSRDSEEYALNLREAFRDEDEWFIHNPSGERWTCADMLLLAHPELLRGGLLLYGAPGQGKSTATRYVAQIHRARILQRLDVRIPERHYGPHRVVFRLDLKDVATWRSGRNPFSKLADQSNTEPSQFLEDYLGFHMSHILNCKGRDAIGGPAVREYVTNRSVLLIFDGLDEVADRATREEISIEIQQLCGRLRRVSEDVQFIVTSRPDVYGQSDAWYGPAVERAYLRDLQWPNIEEYAAKWLTSAKIDDSRAAEIRRELAEKYSEFEHVRALTQNPMQLTILLNLLNTKNASLPYQRTPLYEEYVEVFFRREAAKSDVMKEHNSTVLSFHRYIAWSLHAAAEKLHHPGSYVRDELQAELIRFLERGLIDPALAPRIEDGVEERVMFLVKRTGDRFEFENQSLREFFCAQYLYHSAPSATRDNLPATAPARFKAVVANPYWLNVTRFMAGCFTDGELPLVENVLTELSEQSEFTTSSYLNTVARTLIQDRTFANKLTVLNHLLPLVYADIAIGETSGLVLPAGGGAELLARFCIDRLNGDSASLPIGVEFAKAAGLNGEPDEILNLWLEKVNGASSEHWLRLTAALRVPASLKPAMTLELVRRFPDLTPLLIHSERIRQSSAKEATVLIRQLSSFAASPSASYSRRRVGGHAESVPMTAADLVRRRVVRHLVGVKTGDPIRERARAFRASAEELALYDSEPFAELLSYMVSMDRRTLIQDVSALSRWQRLSDLVGECYGVDSWLAIETGLAGAAIPSRSERGGGAGRLLDNDLPLLARLRHARQRRSDVMWWAQQADSVASGYDRRLLLAALSVWASDDVVLSVAPAVGDFDGVDVDTFSRCVALRQYRHFKQRGRATGKVSAKPEAFDRYSVLALASDRDYLAAHLNYRGDDPVIWTALAPVVESRLLQFGDTSMRERMTLLSHIRESYRVVGAAIDPPVHMLSAVPANDQSWIVSHAKELPLSVVRAAVAYVPASGPLVDVAHRDKWYPTTERSLLGM